MIDSASAVLSQNGGKAFSYRSSKLTQKSIKTPASQLSSHKAFESIS
ncbi:MAG: hypothetical protein ACK55Z_09795 [bacterium]